MRSGLHFSKEARYERTEPSGPCKLLRLWKSAMKTQRWLLPFTCSVHMRAIDAALRVANFNGATLVALSLVAPRPGRGMLHIRLEQIQESRDFLEAVRWKAIRSQTAVELHEVLTNDVPGSIATSVQELACQSIMLINCEARGKRGLQYTLLSEEALKQVLMEPPASWTAKRGAERARCNERDSSCSCGSCRRAAARVSHEQQDPVFCLLKHIGKGCSAYACNAYFAGRGRRSPARPVATQFAGARAQGAPG